MILITSSQNPVIKHLKKLSGSSSYRSKQGQTILDGVHLCDSYLRSGQKPVMCVVGRESKHNHEIKQILDHKSLYHTEFIEVPDSLLSTLSVVDSSVGIIFVIDIPDVQQPNLESSAVLIDRIQDPGNLGTILRTAVAVGIGQVFLSTGSVGAWSQKTLRAGMGAHFVMSIFESVDLIDLIAKSTIPVFTTSLSGKKNIYQTDLRPESAWVFGNEGSGISPEILELCGDNSVIIPQSSDVESLNVASAAAVCLFEQYRQRI